MSFPMTTGAGEIGDLIEAEEAAAEAAAEIHRIHTVTTSENILEDLGLLHRQKRLTCRGCVGWLDSCQHPWEVTA